MGWPGPMTHRQFEAWKVWEDESKNDPGLIEVYIAQACCEIRRVMSTKPGDVKISDFILEFKEKAPVTEEHKRNVSNVAKSVWGARTGMKPQILKPEEVVWVYPPGYKKPVEDN